MWSGFNLYKCKLTIKSCFCDIFQFSGPIKAHGLVS